MPHNYTYFFKFFFYCDFLLTKFKQIVKKVENISVGKEKFSMPRQERHDAKQVVKRVHKLNTTFLLVMSLFLLSTFSVRSESLSDVIYIKKKFGICSGNSGA